MRDEGVASQTRQRHDPLRNTAQLSGSALVIIDFCPLADCRPK